MNFQQIKKVAIITFSRDTIRGVLFRINKGCMEPLNCVTEPLLEEDPSIAWKSVLKQMGRGKDCPIYLSGALRDGICFDTRTAELAPRFQRQALELDLPRHLLTVPENVRIQFSVLKSVEEGVHALRVYAVSEKSFEPIAAMLTQGSSRADGFIFPALALLDDDPPFAAPEMEPDRYFADGNWKVGKPPQDMLRLWQEKLESENLIKPGSDDGLQDWLLHALIVRLLLKKGNDPGLEILPDQLRPQRVKNQLKVTIVLLILLLCSLVWNQWDSWTGSYREMSSLEQSTRRISRENAELKKKLKGAEKKQKEMNRLLNLKTGESDLQGKFADLSSVLPSNILVTSLRWNESGVELQMQTSAAQSNVSEAVRKLPYWKIGQLQQRRWGNSTSTMITLKLIPAEDKK